MKTFLKCAAAVWCTAMFCQAIEHCADSITERAVLQEQARLRAMMEMMRFQQQAEAAEDEKADNSRLRI